MQYITRRLLLKFRSGMHGLNEELEVEKENRNYVLCVVLSVRAWCMCCECSACSSSRASFMVKLEELLGDRHADFEVLNSVEETSYVLGSELWEQNFNLTAYCKRVGGKETNIYIYGDDSCPNQLQSQSSPGGLEGAAGVERQRDGKCRKGI